MFDVFGDTGRIAVSPFREYFVAIGEAPIDEFIRPGSNSGLFRHFPSRGLQEEFVAFLASRYGLPESWVGSAFEQQHFEAGGVYQDEYGYRFFQSSPGR